MTDDPNQALRLKSLVFWLDQINNKTDSLSMINRLWNKKDYLGFRSMFTECPFCGGAPAFEPNKDGKPIVVNGILIERVQCYCLTLELLAKTASRRYESHYTDSKLGDLKPIDVPSGAAARTQSIVVKVGKFLLNPTRSALINGEPGSGKTHILQSVKTALGGFAVYITLADYFDKLMFYTSDKKSKEDGTLHRFLGTLANCPVLLIDDFGLQHETTYGTNTIASIIDHRYAMRRLAPTIMSTNMSLAEMQHTPGVQIGNLERLLSRMMDTENSTTMTMLQHDYRNKLFKKEAGIK